METEMEQTLKDAELLACILNFEMPDGLEFYDFASGPQLLPFPALPSGSYSVTRFVAVRRIADQHTIAARFNVSDEWGTVLSGLTEKFAHLPAQSEPADINTAIKATL